MALCDEIDRMARSITFVMDVKGLSGLKCPLTWETYSKSCIISHRKAIAKTTIRRVKRSMNAGVNHSGISM